MKSTADVHEKLIRVGVQRLLKAGFASTGVAEIAIAAGVPKGSFYYYFDSKEAFACAIVDCWAEMNEQRRRVLLGEHAVAPLQRLRRYFEFQAASLSRGGMTGGCLLGNLSAELADHSEAIRTRLRAAFDQWQATIAEVLEEAHARGELRRGLDPRALAEFIVNAWEGALLRMKAERSDAPLRLFMDTVFEHLLKEPQ